MSLGMSVGLAHSRVEILDEVGLPTVEIFLDGGLPFDQWRQFVTATKPRLASQRSKARSVGNFIDFVCARGSYFLEQTQRHKLFQAFADALLLGTIREGDDPSGLWWLPRTVEQSRKALREVTEFTDWMACEGGVRPLNPQRQATLSEQIAFWRAWRRRTNASLMKHAKNQSNALSASTKSRIAQIRRNPTMSTIEVKAFPEEAFPALIKEGFRRKANIRWTTLRDISIALLLHGGGLRVSEALHLWITDVFQNPDDRNSAIVRVFHPSEGAIPYFDPTTGRKETLTRAEYLDLVYQGRRPLTELAGKKGVGWKDPLLNSRSEKYLQVFWREQTYGRLFLHVHREYLALRPVVSTHPWLFVADTPMRDPMTVRAYEKVHAAAVRRIGLIAGKMLGTTPHGHRHAYGQALKDASLPRKIIMKMMHHKSPQSQDIYTEYTLDDVQQSLKILDDFYSGSRSTSKDIQVL